MCILIDLKYDITIIKNDDSSLCYGVNHYASKIDKFDYFSSDFDFNTKITYLEMCSSTLHLINVSLGVQRTPLADTNCPPAAQHKQAKRDCLL